MISKSRYFSSAVLGKYSVLTSKKHTIQDKCYINGEWITAKSNKSFKITNPVNEGIIATVPDMNTEDVEVAITAAANAFKTWKLTTAKHRSKLLRQWYNLLDANKQSIAKLMTAESGKPLIEAESEVVYGNSFIEWFSEEARRIHGEIVASSSPTRKIMIIKQPIGVVALITPWNFPHAMIARKAGAALAAGCTCIVRPSEETPLTALAMTQLAHEAGFPKGVFNIVTSGRENAAAIGRLFCTNKLVAGISFTGSTAVGKLLYKECASGIKRLSLELGGNAPFIVFNSADLKKAVKGAMASKFRNYGQTCIASNRFFIQDKIYDSFVSNLLKSIKLISVGDGTKAGITAGPLINKTHFEKVSGIVEDAVAKGAKVLLGGKPINGLGNLFYEPTVLTNINESMKVYNEEVFGPVVTIIPFKEENEVIKRVNSTDQGLAAYFYSEDLAQIFRVSNALEAGMVGINEGSISMPEAPFGGVKESGLGREGSHYGIEDFTNVKYLCIGNV